MATPGFTNLELAILWEYRDRIIDAITDPDALAEEACKIDLMHPETKDMLVSFPADIKTKASSLLQSIEGKIKGQPILFHHFLALLKKLSGLTNLGVILQKTYDEKVTAYVVNECGIPRSESADCIDGSTVHVTKDANSYMDQDEHSTIATQQEDNGRSDGSSDSANSAGSVKESIYVYLDVDDTILGVDDAFSVKCAVVNLAARFRSLGCALGLSVPILEEIQTNNPNNVRKALEQVIDTWLALDYNTERFGMPSWRRLASAVVSSAGGHNPRLAQEIANDHPVVRHKRPLEKSSEEAAEKRPFLESNASETDSNIPHSLDVAVDNLLIKHRPKLAAFYSHQPEVPEGTWPPVKKTQYINLALIRTEQAIDFNKEFLRQTIRGSIDDIMKDKDDIKYDEVFTEVEEGVRLVFEGRPGCGKTTMMNKVSQDWANWKIFSSSLLFLVHLRRLENQSDIDLEMVLRSTPVAFTEYEFQQICTQIEGNQGKGVVFALDGLDEYCPEKKKYKSTFIHKLIKGEILPNSIVIVASRPAASQKYRRDATKCIEVLGFLKQQIHQYIVSYFVGDEEKVLGLSTYLEHHPNIMHMCYLPLHMAMIAYLYEIEGASLPQTETEIYNHFTLSTLLRSIRKRNGLEIDEEYTLLSFEDLSPDDKILFDLILKLAFQATVVKPQQVFSASDVQACFNKQSSSTGNDESSLGLVVVDRYFVRYGLKEIYTFLHLTFQEYLAAYHIAQLSFEDQKKLITKYGGDKKLGVVWKFYCGMTQFTDEQKMHAFEQLFEKTKYDLLHQLHCAHESQQDNLCTHVIKSIDLTVTLNKKSLNPSDFTALGYVLTHSNVPATELAITSCHIGPEGLAALVKEINEFSLSLKALSFHRTKIRGMIPEFCDVLKQCPQLCCLIISNCDIINEVLSEMAKMLPRLELLEQLDLSSNNLGRMATTILVSMLTQLPKLKILWPKNIDLLLFKITNERGIEINVINKENSKSSKHDLLRFDNGRKTLQLEDVNFISSYFQAHPCTAALIQEIILWNNKIGDAGAQVLVEGLQYCTSLQKLDLMGNNIGDAGAQALAEGLQHCTKLQESDLYGNNIGDAGVQALVESLQHCTNLQKLDLQRNSLTDGSVGSLSQLIRKAKQLKLLELLCNTEHVVVAYTGTQKHSFSGGLYANQFTDDGMRALRAAAVERKSNPDFVELNLKFTLI